MHFLNYAVIWVMGLNYLTKKINKVAYKDYSSLE